MFETLAAVQMTHIVLVGAQERDVHVCKTIKSIISGRARGREKASLALLSAVQVKLNDLISPIKATAPQGEARGRRCSF